MLEKSISIGRDNSCDYVIIDPQKRVSRKHAQIVIAKNKLGLIDLGSTNGVYVNQKKIEPNKTYAISVTDKVTLSRSYQLDLNEVLNLQNDITLIYPGGGSKNAHLAFENEKAIFRKKNKTVVLDRDKTTITDLSDVDDSVYKIIGRTSDCDFIIDDTDVSRQHCKIRTLSEMVIEVMDLGSTNGTYADGEKLIANKKYQFSSSVVLKIGKKYNLDLKKVFPGLKIIKKKAQNENKPSNNPVAGQSATPSEMKHFNELEEVWNEYVKRQNEAQNASSSYGIGGMIVGAALGAMTGGLAGILLASGGGIFGRYLGQQESSKIRQDLSFETAFLETYACPRCKESFQKKPWITIRDCFKCKLKFRT